MRAAFGLLLALVAARAIALTPVEEQLWYTAREQAAIYGYSKAETAKLYHVAYRLLLSESSGNPYAVNPNDPSRGLAGITDFNARDPWFCSMFNDGQPVDQYNPYDSARVAVRYLAWLHEQTGEGPAQWFWSVLSYKAGLAAVTSTTPWGEAVPLWKRRVSWQVATGGTRQ